MRNLLRLTIVMGAIAAFGAMAWAGSGQYGPHVVNHANVSCLTTCVQAMPQSTPIAGDNTNQPNRICVEIDNTDATHTVAIGDSTTTSTTGSQIPAGGSSTYCVADALTCCGNGGTVVISPTESTRN